MLSATQNKNTRCCHPGNVARPLTEEQTGYRGADRLQRGVSAFQARETGSFRDGKEPWVSWPIMPTLQPPKDTGFPQAVRGCSKATRSILGRKLRLCRAVEDDVTALLPHVHSWLVLRM